jgi:hypothetical protein
MILDAASGPAAREPGATRETGPRDEASSAQVDNQFALIEPNR